MSTSELQPKDPWPYGGTRREQDCRSGRVAGQSEDEPTAGQREGLFITIFNELSLEVAHGEDGEPKHPVAFEAEVVAVGVPPQDARPQLVRYPRSTPGRVTPAPFYVPPQGRDYRLILDGEIGPSLSRSFWLSSARVRALLEQGDGRLSFSVSGQQGTMTQKVTRPIRMEPCAAGELRRLEVRVRDGGERSSAALEIRSVARWRC